MENLDKLWQAVSIASDLRDLTRHKQTYYFQTVGPITFYLRAENAEVQIMRWALPKVEVSVFLQAAFGWRLVTDQDEAGVYVVAKRRRVVGELSSAMFAVIVPDDAFLMLALEDGRVVIEHVSGTLHVPPPDAHGTYKLLPAGK